MILVLFGPPGAGKGTQSQMLVSRLGFRHVSTGDLLRQAIHQGSPLGLEAKKIMDQGALVPDEVVIGMVKEKLEELSGCSVVLDGFPRTVKQAEALDEMFSLKAWKLSGAVFLEVAKSKIVRRLSGRRQTSDGRHVYHIEFNPPKVEGLCDVTGEALIQRDDDREEVISARLEAYEKSTSPLKSFYQDRNCLKVVDGDGELEEVFARLKSSISFLEEDFEKK